MIYLKHQPSASLLPFIQCYWLIDSGGDESISEEKIIPDGYPETIWHYGDAYEINISGKWQPQQRALLAGQLTNHFYLRNTGVSGMIGIKWKPDALHQLFGIDMSELVDNVVALPVSLSPLFDPLKDLVVGSPSKEILKLLDEYLTFLIHGSDQKSAVSEALSTIHSTKGKIDIEELSVQLKISSRSLERHFRKSVGLSPKFYSRIIRLNHVFEMVQSGNRDWADIVYQSGFYDQAHFIKNFKEFIGEDPSRYGFDADNMANFHLRK